MAMKAEAFLQSCGVLKRIWWCSRLAGLELVWELRDRVHTLGINVGAVSNYLALCVFQKAMATFSGQFMYACKYVHDRVCKHDRAAAPAHKE